MAISFIFITFDPLITMEMVFGLHYIFQQPASVALDRKATIYSQNFVDLGQLYNILCNSDLKIAMQTEHCELKGTRWADGFLHSSVWY